MANPFIPFLLEPRNRGALDASATQFTFQYNHPTAGKAGDRVFLRRKQLTPLAGVHQWWNGTEWLPTELSIALAMVPGGEYTVAAGGFGNGIIYQWSIQVRDADAAVSGYANDFLVDIHSKPTPIISQPAGAQPISRPDIVWVWDSTAGSRQAKYRLAIYTSAVYGAPGFDPALPAWQSEANWIMPDFKVSSSDWSYTPKGFSIETGVNYRVYGLFVDEDDLDSGWVAGATFTGSIASLPAPAVSASPNPDFGRVDLVISSSYNLLGENDSDFTSGVGGWHGIINANVFPTTEQFLYGSSSMRVEIGGLTYAELDAAHTTYTAQDTAYADYAAQKAAMASPVGTSRIASPEGTSGVPVTVATAYSAMASVRPTAGAKNARLAIMWFTAAGAPCATPLSEGTVTPVPKDVWTEIRVTDATAPATAAFAAIRIEFTTTAVDEVFYVDGVALAQASNVVWQGGSVELAYVVERSLDGVNWTELWGATRDNPYESQATTVRISDRAAPLFSGTVQYRVFGVATPDTAPVFSQATLVSVSNVQANSWWLRVPDNVGEDVPMFVESATQHSNEDKEVFLPDGSPKPVVLRTGLPVVTTITVTTKTRYKSHFDGLIAALTNGKILYLQSTMDGHGWYIDPGESRDVEQLRAVALATENTNVRHLHSVRFTAVVVEEPVITSVAV